MRGYLNSLGLYLDLAGEVEWAEPGKGEVFLLTNVGPDNSDEGESRIQ